MKKTYTFAFPGSKEQFLNQLEQYVHNNKKLGYPDDYIIDISEDVIRFGVARGGHSGGYWFLPTITETDEYTVLSGKIRYDGPGVTEKGFAKAVTAIGDVLAFLFFLPVIVGFNLYRLVKWSIQKIRRQPIPKEPTPEDRLIHLMQNRLYCTFRDSAPHNRT